MLAWLALTIFLAQHHALWRDEVHALSIALSGQNVLDMLRALHGEGHPVIWFLMLRGAYALTARVEVLPLVAWLVGFTAAALFVLRAPFRWPVLALFALGNVAAYEYAVMARNYGISMLLMFALAILYPRRHRNGLLLGLLLLLLANTNVHSVLVAGGFMLLWLADLLREQGLRWTPALGNFAIAATLLLIGVVACALTVYPPMHDAAVMEHVQLSPMFLEMTVEPLLRLPGPVPMQLIAVLAFVFSLAIIGSIWGLVRSTGAFLAAVGTLVGFLLLFSVVYPGDLRHEALWLVFLLSLYWIEQERAVQPVVAVPPRQEIPTDIAPRIGWVSVVILLASQIPGIASQLHDSLTSKPESRSRDFAAFLAAQPQFARATLIADPDFLLEPLPYYLPNRTYLMREHRFGRFVIYRKNAQQSLSLDQILENAGALTQADGKPVVILLHRQLDAPALSPIAREGYNWELVAPMDQVRRFLGHTRLLGRFRPAQTNEDFDAYEYVEDLRAQAD